MTSALSFPHDVLTAFAAASGDHSPLHGDEEYARATSFGQLIVHGSFSLLVMLARVPVGVQHLPLLVDAVFRQPVLPDRTYTLQVGEREKGWRVELLDDRLSLIASNVGPALDRPALTHSDRQPSPMRGSSATPTASQLMSGPSVWGEYRPDAESLVALARRHSGEEVSDEIAVALGWISYVAGMELPGRDSMCRRIRLTLLDRISPAEAFTFGAAVEMFDERTNLLNVSGSLFQDERAVAACSLGVHWRRDMAEAKL